MATSFNLLLSGNPKRGTWANSADPDQILHDVKHSFF